MSNIVAYLRVSKERKPKPREPERKQSSNGIEAQRAAIARFAEQEALTIALNSKRSRPAKAQTRSSVVQSSRRRSIRQRFCVAQS
jgi:hypothetical protein